MIRKVTIPPELSAEADAYALADHRSFSRLVCEALRQHMNRYPKNRTVPSGHAEIKQIRADLERVKAASTRYGESPRRGTRRYIPGQSTGGSVT